MAKVRETELGRYLQDPSGLWHYQPRDSVHLSASAARDALASRPAGPCWFWFDGTFCPIYPKDIPYDLVVRWRQWQERCKETPQALYGLLRTLANVSEFT